jgi:hypothetical protein
MVKQEATKGTIKAIPALCATLVNDDTDEDVRENPETVLNVGFRDEVLPSPFGGHGESKIVAVGK